jgi:hypothetical protein
MSQVQEALEAFLRAVGQTPDLWSSFDARCIAVRVEGEWHNLVTRLRLDERSPDTVPRLAHLPVTELLVCRQTVLPTDDFERFIRSLCDGRAEIAGSQIDFMNLESGAAVPYNRGSAWIATRSTWQRDFERFPTAHRFTLYGGSDGLFRRAHIDREALDVLVSTLERPWDGLDSLTQHALRTATRLDQSGTPTVEVVAPLEARLEECRLEAGTLRCIVAAGSRPVAERCSVGLFGVQSSGGIVSERLRMSSKSWKRAADGADYRCDSARSADGALRVSVMLSVGPFIAERQTASDAVELGENPRVVAYGQFDPGLKRLTEVVQDPAKAKNEDEFHSIVARLFTLAGFAVDSFVADTSLSGKGIPDLLAYMPHEGSLLVVECTIGPLASLRDKLSWLVARARRVRAVLKSGSDEQVLPVIVTAQPNVAPHELDAARRSRVAVLAQKELQELLELAQKQEPLQGIMRWCQAHIPAKGPSSPPLGRMR